MAVETATVNYLIIDTCGRKFHYASFRDAFHKHLRHYLFIVLIIMLEWANAFSTWNKSQINSTKPIFESTNPTTPFFGYYNGILYSTLGLYGIWSSNDEGITWNYYSNYIPSFTHGNRWYKYNVNNSFNNHGDACIYYSDNSSFSWNPMLSTRQMEDVNTIIFHNGELFVGTWTQGVFRSSDEGVTWVKNNTGFDNWYTITSQFVVYNNKLFVIRSTMIHGSTPGEIYSLNDINHSWEKINIFNDKNITRLFNINTLMFAFGGEYASYNSTNTLYYSKDDGSSWAILNTNGIKHSGKYLFISCVEIYNNCIYLGTTTEGIWYSSDFGKNWISDNDGLPRIGVGVFKGALETIQSLIVSGDNLIVGIQSAGIYYKHIKAFHFLAFNERGDAIDRLTYNGTLSLDNTIILAKNTEPDDGYILSNGNIVVTTQNPGSVILLDKTGKIISQKPLTYAHGVTVSGHNIIACEQRSYNEQQSKYIGQPAFGIYSYDLIPQNPPVTILPDWKKLPINSSTGPFAIISLKNKYVIGEYDGVNKNGSPSISIRILSPEMLLGNFNSKVMGLKIISQSEYTTVILGSNSSTGGFVEIGWKLNGYDILFYDPNGNIVTNQSVKYPTNISGNPYSIIGISANQAIVSIGDNSLNKGMMLINQYGDCYPISTKYGSYVNFYQLKP